MLCCPTGNISLSAITAVLLQSLSAVQVFIALKGRQKPTIRNFLSFGPSKQVDFELEIGFIIGQNSALGSSIDTSEAESYIFGLVLFNDLSARDIQKWEYVPLGPFLSKNFGSVISPWIVTIEALEPFRIAGSVQVPEVMPYLRFEGERHFDINLEVWFEIGKATVSTRNPEPGTRNIKLISRSNLKYLYWNFAQMLAHHTVNGCNMEVGDICASGTISGPDEGAYGSMLELAWKGTRPIVMPDGSSRKFIEDHDSVVFRGYAVKEGLRVGFGECRTQILPAK